MIINRCKTLAYTKGSKLTISKFVFLENKLLISSVTRNYSIRTTPSSLHTKNYTTASSNNLSNSSRRAPTSLSNTAKAFGSNKVATPSLTIIDQKFAEDGKPLVLDISERAITKLNEIAKEESNPNTALRISVESGGCHGFQYNLVLSDISTKTEDDCIFEKGGAKVIIDDSSLNILRESTVDYTNELIGSMFKVVDSPYTTSSCGCGSSFDFDFDKLSSGAK